MHNYTIIFLLFAGGSARIAEFGKEWPPLKECLEYSEETGDWAVLDKTIPGLYAKEGYPRPVWSIYASRRFRFMPNGEFTIRFEYVAKGTNRFGRRVSVEGPEQTVVRCGKWQLDHRVPTADEGKALFGEAVKEKVYFLTLVFENNKIATGHEKAVGSPINGTVVMGLDEREHLNGSTRLGHLRWTRILNEEDKLLYKWRTPEDHYEGTLYIFPFLRTMVGENRVGFNDDYPPPSSVWMVHADPIEEKTTTTLKWRSR